jgi:hypothetical protein
MELMNGSRKESGKGIFTEGRVVESRTLKRVCLPHCGTVKGAAGRDPGGNTTFDEVRALTESCRVFSAERSNGGQK